jgi:HK97 family phage prohead protease
MEEFKTKEFTVLTPFSIVTKDAATVTDITSDNVIRIAGYANWSGSDDTGKTYVDLTGDVVVPSGVDTSVWSLNPQILWQHDREETIGVGITLEKRSDGVYIEAEIHRDAMDEKEWYRVKSGLVKMFSIGFKTQAGEYREVDGDDVFFITKALLLEVSIVSIPANSKSSFSQIKSLGDGFTSDKASIMDEDKEHKNNTKDTKDTTMTNIKVKRAELLSAADLESFKKLGGDTEADVEVSLADFIKGMVAQEVSSILAEREKYAAEVAQKAAELEAEKAAELEAEKAAEVEAQAIVDAEAKIEEEKALADEVVSLKELVDTLKAAIAVEEK